MLVTPPPHNIKENSVHFIKNGDYFSFAKGLPDVLHEKLPAGNYIIVQTMEGYILQVVDPFTHLPRYYGSTVSDSNRVLQTFADRSYTTGILLSGEKGSGKSLLAKHICISAAEQGIPTLIINKALAGDAFNAFIQAIDQPCILLFDEFEKVYPPDIQQILLTLLDGVFPTKKLFIMTVNNSGKMDVNMKNRPGRLFYMLEYKGLDAAFVEEYCIENLNDKTKVKQVATLMNLFYDFNFDMLKSIVEEMNRYDEDAIDVVKFLNAKPEFGRGNSDSYEIEFEGLDKDVEIETRLWYGNPIVNKDVYIDGGRKTGKIDEDGDAEYEDVDLRFSQKDMVSMNLLNGVAIYQREDGVKLTLKKKKDDPFDYSKLL